MAEPPQYIGLLPFTPIQFTQTNGDPLTLYKHMITNVEPRNAGTTHIRDANDRRWRVNGAYALIIAQIDAA